MERSAHKIYCAGPLFNPTERGEMRLIASALEEAGYSVFLPQRDGLEFAELFPLFLKKGISVQEAQTILNMAIFSLDVFEIIDSAGLVLNMNGRVPDEGAMVEAGIAWAHDKVVVIFRTDSRSLIEGNCNPLVLGLSDFSWVDNYEGIAPAFETKFAAAERAMLSRASGFRTAAQSGKEISAYIASHKSRSDIADLLIGLFKERICQTSEDLKGNYSQTSTPP